MNGEILINVTPQETRVAVLQQGVVQELHVERASSRGLVGNIYLGLVSRVLPGMQSAFVQIGLDRAAFLDELLVLQPGETDRENAARRTETAGPGDQGSDRNKGRASVDADQYCRKTSGVPAARVAYRYFTAHRR